MKTVVITGGTRGIGRGLALELLKRGARVAISGRNGATATKAAAELEAAASASGRIIGVGCDASSFEQAQALWDAAAAKFGRIDIWVNNAGISAPRKPFTAQKPETMREVVDTNILGVMYATSVALAGMGKQGSGFIWNMEGFGSGGQKQNGMAVYGLTKRAVTYFTESVAKELKDSKVGVGFLSPGIVATDLLLGDYKDSTAEWERAKKIFNILGDKVETVTPFLAEGILNTTKNGARVAWLTSGKAFARFATAAFKKRDLFS